MGMPNSEKSFFTALVLCWFLGLLGIHRFYLGKSGTGIVMLLTLGGLGIWTVIDFVIIATGNFSDSNGLKIKMASKPRVCAQCGKPLADSLSTFCSECSAHTTENVSGTVETQIEVTAEALRRVEKEKQSRKVKRVGIGCLVLIILVGVMSTCLYLATPPLDIGGPELISDNLDAERLVKVGMKNTEVGELRDPSTRFVMLNLKPSLNNDEFYIDVPLGEGKSIALTPIGASIDSPFYVWIFFPTLVASSNPTFIFFASNEDSSEVINVLRFDCVYTVGAIILAGQHTEFPSNASICVP